ncbi:hypothetical protein SAMN05444858_1391 [Micromonospora avicenniae]|uniref:Uncharacterized protein n=1 Tax=Micromonospora avicenniae TaxID=1198245 RepID=A0A1N7FK36_9ACTN|nr:hypothetical protein SAMN05444858_1391 [Micromonospora avicenniae]
MDDQRVDQPAGTPKTDALEDALKAFLDPDTAGRGSIGWIFGDSSEPPAGIGTVAMLIASPATPHAHRSVLIQSLVHAIKTAETHPEPIHTYLAAHRGLVYRLVELMTERGPAPWRSRAVAELAARTGLTRAESTLLLAGLPVRNWDEHSFLSDEQMAILRITANEAKIGRMELLTLAYPDRIRLVDAAMPDDPATLWDQGPDVPQLSARWIETQGRRVPVREDLLAELATVMGFPTGILRTFAEPTPGDWLHTDGECSTVAGLISTTAPAGGEPFSDRHLPSAATGLAWLAYHLPAGDPIRANLGRVYELIRLRLRNPKLLIGTVRLDPKEAPTHHSPAVVAGIRLPTGQTCYHLRPAHITDPHDPALDVIPDHSPISIRLMLDPAFGRMITALESSGLPAGTYAQNAVLTAPHLVTQVADKFCLDAAAASLYLQMLALPDPTDANLRRWNNWDTTELADLGSALVRSGLLIEDTRTAAARRFFLPGPWMVRKFVPPFEAWKSSLYGFSPDQEPPYRWTLVSRPVAELFQAAAERILAGDTPNDFGVTMTNKP